MLVVKIKKQKGKKYAIKRKCKFEDYKNFLETSQLSNKINHLKMRYIVFTKS